MPSPGVADIEEELGRPAQVHAHREADNSLVHDLRAERLLVADAHGEDDASPPVGRLIVRVHSDDGREHLARPRQADEHLAHGMAVEPAGVGGLADRKRPAAAAGVS